MTDDKKKRLELDPLEIPHNYENLSYTSIEDNPYYNPESQVWYEDKIDKVYTVELAKFKDWLKVDITDEGRNEAYTGTIFSRLLNLLMFPITYVLFGKFKV